MDMMNIRRKYENRITDRWIYEKALFYLEECRLVFESY